MSAKEQKDVEDEKVVEAVQELVTGLSQQFLISPKPIMKEEKDIVICGFAWGTAQHGQLGMNPYSETKEEGVDVVNLMECAKMGMSPMEEGIRMGVMSVPVPKKMWFPQSVGEIVSLSTSFYHTLCCESNGRCYSWGAPFLLGWKSKCNQAVPRALLLRSDIKIVQVAAGKYHSIARDDLGNVYCWGSLKDGRLGFGDFSKSEKKTKWRPGHVKINTEISYVAVGEDCSFAVGEGEVWVWGKNTSGLLGSTQQFKEDGIVYTPCLSNAFQNYSIKTLSCPFNHGVALTEDKNVITWGSNRKLLGRSSKGYIDKITPCDVDENEMGNTDVGYVCAVAGRSHSIVLEASGKLSVWGITKEPHERVVAAQSPSFKEEYIKSPIAIDSFHAIVGKNLAKDFNGENLLPMKMFCFKTQDDIPPVAACIERVAVYCFHSVVVSKDQRVYTWGVDKVNRLGRSVSNSNHTNMVDYIPSQIHLSSDMCGSSFRGAKFPWEIHNISNHGEEEEEDDKNVSGEDEDTKKKNTAVVTKNEARIQVQLVDAGEAQSFVLCVFSGKKEEEKSDVVEDDIDIDIEEKEDDEEEEDEEEEKEEGGNIEESGGGCCKCCVVS
jgi:alpha-tubulin suppressor-like RCC1 family protein